MVTVTYVSDLHLEFYNSFPNKYKKWDSNKDILCLAGDIGKPSKNTYKEFIEYSSGLFKYVFVITGNHEYYGKESINHVDVNIEKICSHYKNVYFLNNKTHYIKEYDLYILGTTLWTKGAYCFEYNDFNCIKGMNAEYLALLHNKALNYLETELEKIDISSKVIVLSHHMPSFNLINSKYKNFPYNCLFASDLNYLFEKYKINFWICGHSHSSNKLKINNTLVLMNPMGYENENDSFDWNAFFKLK